MLKKEERKRKESSATTCTVVAGVSNVHPGLSSLVYLIPVVKVSSHASVFKNSIHSTWKTMGKGKGRANREKNALYSFT